MRTAKMQLLMLLATGLLVLGLGEPRAKADPITITFDDVPAGLTDPGEYASDGVYLVSANSSFGVVNGLFADFWVQSCTCAMSHPNVALGGSFDFQSPFFHDLVGFFFLPGTQVRATTNSVSFYVLGTTPGGMDPWTAVIFGKGSDDFIEINDDRLETVSGTGDAFVSFTTPAYDIAGFLLLTSTRRESIDNLSFNTPEIPEPSTILLLATGLAGVVTKIRGHR